VIPVLITKGVEKVALLVGVLLFHEIGHFIGMRYFDYRDVKMFFIPLFGAAVSGKKEDAPAWQQAIVLLLGPLPGLALGCALYFCDLAWPSELLRDAARILVYLNLFNLLPVRPLDGGRLLHLLLFSRHRGLEAVALVTTTSALAIWWWQSFACGSVVIMLLALITTISGLRSSKAAAAIRRRWPSLAPRLVDLTEREWRDLFDEVHQHFRDAKQPKQVAIWMKDVHRRVITRSTPARTTLGFLTIYLAAFVLVALTCEATPLDEDARDWFTHAADAMGRN
jgi:Zn-dependent protease